MSDHPPTQHAKRARGVVPATVISGVFLLTILMLAGAAGPCEYKPRLEPLEYGLSEATHAALEGADYLDAPADALEAQIAGALEFLVGTPQHPQYLLLEDWYDQELNPNYGSDELSDADFDQLVEDNRLRFAPQLRMIHARRYSEVIEPRYAADLWQRWTSEYLPGLLEDPEAEVDLGDGETATRHEDAIYFIEHWYPTLRESALTYRQQCFHCHGTEGGGNGPTSKFLDPLPRDYRQGVFKWVSVDRNTRPRREDLHRILSDGVQGTAMPPFARFSTGVIHGLVDYVRLLAVRGEVERLLAATAASEGYLPPASVLENYELVWNRWLDSANNYTWFDGEVPKATPETIAHGKELFQSEPANCFTCHGMDGRGDGEAIFETNAEGERVRRLDEWGQPSNPRNFQQAILRGSGRPIDMWRRVRYGIGGTIMPAAEASVSDEDLWHIVHFVQSLLQENDITRVTERKLAARASAHDGHGAGAHDETGEAGHGEDAGDDGHESESGH
jgi:mono/diheme cytochrome c family protein